MTRRDDDRERTTARPRRPGRVWRDEEDPDRADRAFRGDEARVMDMARKLVRGGAELVFNTQGAIRERTSEIKRKEIPKELVESVAHITARTKDELVGLMAREFKSYLEKLDLGEELRTLAEDYTLDINMSIRLRPNEAFGTREDDRSAGDGDAPPAEDPATPVDAGNGDEVDPRATPGSNG